jgi:hypothetical protein
VGPDDGAANIYARFAQEFRNTVMAGFIDAQAVKGRAKLGSPTADQVFIPIAPCRVVDTRNAGGPVTAGTARNFYYWTPNSSGDWSSQGGPAGPAGTTCPGTINPNGGAPSAALATITVVSPSDAGNFVAWTGASPVPLTSVLNWRLPGDIAANTTVIPAGGRTGTGPGGSIEDFAIFYNGPSGSAQVVVDVIGYLVENQATALSCLDSIPVSSAPIAANGVGQTSTPACATGYSLVGISCYMSGLGGWIVASDVPNQICIGHASPTATDAVTGRSRCCRIPGR